MIISFKCKFLSDVVLTSQAATEGFHKSLDYIPGGKFLGILATKAYDEKDEVKTLNIFHNGNVKFGNAYPIVNNQSGYPMPFAWFRDKLKKEEEVYLHHKIDENFRETLRANSKQLKQERSGFLNMDGTNFLNLSQKFAIKSAYDSDKRRSKDNEMYGYYSISAGSEFIFNVEIIENTVSPDIIRQGLVGLQKIGRSKSAEYGLAEIKEYKLDTISSTQPVNRELVVYAHSDLCFIDDNGYCTLDLKPEMFGLSTTAKILWDKCQIKTRVHQSYNGKRKTSNADLAVIQKGSVIIIETSATDELLSHVGNYHNEGFGKVIYNPDFLMATGPTLSIPKEGEIGFVLRQTAVIDKGNNDDLIIAMLDRRNTLKQTDQNIEKEVEEFVNENYTLFKSISKSQWGAIRSIAKSTPNEEELVELLFHKDEQEDKKSRGFLRRGIAAKNWEKKADTLLAFIENHKENRKEILIKTASKMQKRKEHEK